MIFDFHFIYVVSFAFALDGVAIRQDQKWRKVLFATETIRNRTREFIKNRRCIKRRIENTYDFCFETMFILIFSSWSIAIRCKIYYFKKKHYGLVVRICFKNTVDLIQRLNEYSSLTIIMRVSISFTEYYWIYN